MKYSTLYSDLCDLNIFTSRNRINPHFQQKMNDVIIERVYRCTEFLPSSASLKERLFCIKNEIVEQKRCQHCNKPVSFNNHHYKTFCSRKCASTTNRKTRSDKSKQAIKEKYGVDNIFKLKDVQDKILNDRLKKYGVSNVMLDSQIKDRRARTNIEKYGNVSPLTNETVKRKSEATNYAKFGNTIASKNSDIKNKIKTTFEERYGTGINQQHLSKDTISKLSDKKYLKKCHHDDLMTLSNIAERLGVDTTTVSNWMFKHDIKILRFQASSYEKWIVDSLKDNGIENILVNDRSIIAPRELDIVLPDHALAIEVCGLYWHNELHVSKNYHLDKWKKCKEQGIALLTIFEDEILERPEVVLNTILHKCGIRKDKVFARKTKVDPKVEMQERKEFLHEHHIQGNGIGSICIGLRDSSNNLVAVMLFKKVERSLELNRYATSKNVPGGFSKLLSYAISNYRPKTIYSFADLRWSIGDLYRKNGFDQIYVSSPDYYYVKGTKRFHKFGFRHRFLSSKLQNYDQSLSEHQNCLNNKVYRIYNCGLIKFEKRFD